MTKMFAIAALALLVSGCQLPRALTASDIDSPGPELHLRTVKLIDGTKVDFRSDSLGYAVIQDSMVVRKLGGGELRKIPLDSVSVPEGTRYPTSSESATQNLILGCSMVGLLLWFTLNPIHIKM
jgi:hypothetical protein